MSSEENRNDGSGARMEELDWMARDILRGVSEADGTADISEIKTRIGVENVGSINYRLNDVSHFQYLLNSISSFLRRAIFVEWQIFTHFEFRGHTQHFPGIVRLSDRDQISMNLLLTSDTGEIRFDQICGWQSAHLFAEWLNGNGEITRRKMIGPFI